MSAGLFCRRTISLDDDDDDDDAIEAIIKNTLTTCVLFICWFKEMLSSQ